MTINAIAKMGQMKKGAIVTATEKFCAQLILILDNSATLRNKNVTVCCIFVMHATITSYCRNYGHIYIFIAQNLTFKRCSFF